MYFEDYFCHGPYQKYCNGLNNRGGQKGGLRPITYIHGRNSRGGQNLGQTQAEHANLIDHQRAAAEGGRPSSRLFQWPVRPGFARGLAPHSFCDHAYT